MDGKKENGTTASEVPITITRSALDIISGASLNFLGNCSPKNMMSGFTNPLHPSLVEQYNGSIFSKAVFQFSIGSSPLHSRQCADRLWPCAYNSFSSFKPALIYKPSIFWVIFISKTPSSYNFLIKRCPNVGSYYFPKYSYDSFMKGLGSFTKNLISKIASGKGRLYYLSLL